MSSTKKNAIRGLGAWFISRFGSRVCDHRTDEFLGRALILVWGGRVLLIGYDGEIPVKPVFVSDPEIRYWRQTIGFESHEAPDFERSSRVVPEEPIQ